MSDVIKIVIRRNGKKYGVKRIISTTMSELANVDLLLKEGIAGLNKIVDDIKEVEAKEDE